MAEWIDYDCPFKQIHHLANSNFEFVQTVHNMERGTVVGH